MLLAVHPFFKLPSQTPLPLLFGRQQGVYVHKKVFVRRAGARKKMQNLNNLNNAARILRPSRLAQTAIIQRPGDCSFLVGAFL